MVNNVYLALLEATIIVVVDFNVLVVDIGVVVVVVNPQMWAVL